MNLLLFSNSTMIGHPFLDFPMPYIVNFLGSKPGNILFIPFAGVTLTWDDYANRVAERFNGFDCEFTSIHNSTNMIEAIENANVIVVGGGNTWQLVHYMHKYNLVLAIRNKVIAGTKYIGWSAGSNLACPTLKTTNDMPIIDPLGFDTLNLIPFQINPHYLDKNPEGHGGESREDRILEFLEINKETSVVGLREGCLFEINNGNIEFKGEQALRVFNYNTQAYELNPGADVRFLLNSTCSI